MGWLSNNWKEPDEDRTFDLSRGINSQLDQERAYQTSDLDFFTGALGSFVSSVPELFGMRPNPSIQRWRDDHPVADLVTQLAGFAIPYGGAYKLSTLPANAKRLEGITEGTLKAFGTTSARSPVIGGALKEFYRYSPLEISRLGTGWALDADMGDMFSDVFLSQAIAGGLGGLGGFLRAGGRAAAKIGAALPEAEYGLMPTFELRMAKEPGAKIVGDLDPQQFIYDKRLEVLKQVPERPQRGMQGKYFYDVEGSTPELAGQLEAWMKPNGSNWTQEVLEGKPWDVRQLHTDGKAWSVGEGTGDAVAQAAGFKDLDELAETVVYPRLMTVNKTREGAGIIGAELKKMLDVDMVRRIDDDLIMWKEQDGLWGFMKRTARGEEPPAPAKGRRPAYQFGPAKVRKGDQWLLGKTDQPGKLAPELHKINQSTVERWAKLKDPWRVIRTNNKFNQEMNLITRMIEPTDWQLAQKLNKSTWVAQTAPKYAAKVKAATGLADQAGIHSMTEHLYDVIAPKAAKLISNPVYARFYSPLEGGMKLADRLLKYRMEGVPTTSGSQAEALMSKNVKFTDYAGHQPIKPLIRSLTPEEFQQVLMVSDAQFPAKELPEMVKQGILSPRAEAAAKALQDINKSIIGEDIIPALEEAGMAGQISWLEGYIAPRMFRGDAMVRVTDEGGRLQTVVSGVTHLEAQRTAEAVVKEAALEGKIWTAQEVESKALKGTPGEVDDLEKAFEQVHERMGQSQDAQLIVQKAMRRMLAEKPSITQPGGIPGTLKYKRTGIDTAPGLEQYTHEDFIKAIENHYRQLLRFSAYHSWRNRFGEAALRWGKADETAYTDVMRKAGQWLGIEGQYTKTVNKVLEPLLGPLLGPKAATRIAQATNSLMYQWTLGMLNPSFAVLNLLTPFMTVTPWISFMQKAPSQYVSGLMQQELRLNSKGLVEGTVGVLSPLKVTMKSIRMLSGEMEPELRQMVDQALADGVMSPQLFDAVYGHGSEMATSIREAWGRNALDGLKTTANFMSTKSEQFSRAIAFNASYLVGKHMYGLEGDKLYRFMRKANETTMYGYGVMDRSRVLTGPLGSTFGLFKNWQFHFIHNMLTYANLTVKEGIWAPLIWQNASALALGGLGATPLVYLADGLAKWNSDSPNSFHYLMKNWNGPAGDAIYFGFPALLGVSLQASSALPGTDVVQDIESLTNVVAWERAKAAWSSIGEAADLWEQTGRNPLQNPNVRDKLMAAFLPRAGFRLFSVTEGDYIRSMSTGYPTVRGLTPVQKVLHGAGFNVPDIEKNYIAGEFSWRKREETRAAIQALGDEFAQAQLAHDAEEMTSIMRRATAMGVSVHSVASSAQTRYRRETLGSHLSQFGAEDQTEWAPALK